MNWNNYDEPHQCDVPQKNADMAVHAHSLSTWLDPLRSRKLHMSKTMTTDTITTGAIIFYGINSLQNTLSNSTSILGFLESVANKKHAKV